MRDRSQEPKAISYSKLAERGKSQAKREMIAAAPAAIVAAIIKHLSDGQLTRVKGKLNIQDDWAERKIEGKNPKKEKFWFLKKQAGVKPKAREIAKSRRFNFRF